MVKHSRGRGRQTDCHIKAAKKRESPREVSPFAGGVEKGKCGVERIPWHPWKNRKEKKGERTVSENKGRDPL